MQLTENMKSYIQDLKYFNKKDDSFEKIYKDAQSKDVDLSNAKEIVSSLSKLELGTIQKYKSLADAINVDSLSKEGAYNLLVHNYENIDYDGDGYTEVGIGKSVNLIPQEVPHDFREKFIATLKEMKQNGADDFEVMAATISTFGEYTFAKLDKLHYDEDISYRELLAQHGINQFIVKTPTFDENYILELKDKLEHPKSGEYSSPEFREVMRKFFEAYAEVSKNFDKTTTLSLEKVAFDYKLNSTNHV